MGSNDSLAGSVTGVGETTTTEVRGSGARSDRSKSKRPIRGAPPSSLSQPVYPDRSRSSSPSKTNSTPSLPTSRSASPAKTPAAPSNARSSSTPLSKGTNTLERSLGAATQRGRPGVKGKAVAFKHHRFLLHNITATPPPISSFQPQIPISEAQLPSPSYRAFEFKTSAPISPTTNINVTGEILSPPSASQQPDIPSIPNFIKPIPTSRSLSETTMSSTVESSSTRTFRPGSERGYDNSPMAHLMRQYKEDSNDNDTSTWQRATTLSSKKSLLPNDIVEKRGIQRAYALHPDLFYEVTRVVSELQIFLERTSAMITERTSYFKVDPRDTFLSILKESSDQGQIHAAWMGLSRRMALAQENLTKYELQYRGSIEGEDLLMLTSPISTDVGIYEAMEGEEDKDSYMRYIYENVPHHQDQICSPHKLRDGATWSSIISLPSNVQDSTSSTLPTIPEQEYVSDSPEVVTSRRDVKGKRRITDEFTSPPTSPRVLNVGYGTPFKSSSQFFVRPGIPLPPSETLSQKSVLLGLGLPETPAFENISSVQAKDTRNFQKSLQPRASNPFEGRDTPPHMSTSHRAHTQVDMRIPGQSNNNQSQSHEIRSERDSTPERQPPTDRGSRRNHPGGDPDDDDDDDSSNDPHGGNGPPNRGTPSHNQPPNSNGGGGGGNNPGGGGGGDGPNGGGYQSNLPQGHIPYGNLVATIRNELKQDQLPIWDGNKDTAIEYFWKIQQLAALEGDIPVALGFWLWKSLKENSKIWMWFTTLPFSEQAKMRTHYLHYLKGIKDNYLG